MRIVLQLGMLAAVTLVFLGSSVSAALSASSTITQQQLGPGDYRYTLTLTDTGSTPISTFWFGWIPAYDLLPHAPTNFASPTGWTGTDAPDVFGVASAQWVNTTTPLQPGHSLSGFAFDTPDANITTGTSAFFGLPIDETYVYIGAPETDPGFALTPTVVATPEPVSLGLLVMPAAALLIRRRSPGL